VPRPRVDVVLLDRYTRRVLGHYALHKGTVRLIFSGKRANIRNDIEKIEKILGRKAHPLVMDLYNMALTVYMADLLIKRVPKTGCRSISVLISVSDKSKWDSLKDDLVGTLRFLSGDNFDFHFVQGRRPRKFVFEEKDKRVVSLFSGGLDSFAGVKWLLDRDIEPILVSHCGQNTICSAQSLLARSINRICGKDLSFYQISARAKFGKGMAQREYTQRSRSFLYLSLGMLIALEIGARRMFVFENGVLAINIPITQSRVYGNTRTTHPDFIARYSNLIDKIFLAKVSIENPFLYMTKGEAISILNASGFRTLVKKTITCSRLGRLRYEGVSVKRTSHCGVCLPCVLRRAAINYANLGGSDARYNHNIKADPEDLPEEGKTILFELMDFGYKLNTCKNDTEVLLKYPQFYVETADVPDLIDMYRRHVAELEVLLA
jgi:7-cyano-7-deazaguanine synthase in queuosine biosynthesis